jgi:hypothetical protein
MGRGLGKGLREFKSSVTGDHTSEDAFDVSKLAVADDEPVAVDRANAA